MSRVGRGSRDSVVVEAAVDTIDTFSQGMLEGWIVNSHDPWIRVMKDHPVQVVVLVQVWMFIHVVEDELSLVSSQSSPKR